MEQLHRYAELAHLSFEDKERIFLAWLLQAVISPATRLEVPDTVIEAIAEDPALISPALEGLMREETTETTDSLSLDEKSRMYLAWLLQAVLSPRTRRQVSPEVTRVLVEQLDVIWPLTAYGLHLERHGGAGRS